MPESKIDIYTDTHASPEKIKEVQNALKYLGIETEETKKKTAEATETHGQAWQQFLKGQIAANILTKAYRELVDLVKSSISAAAESEKAQRGMESALFTTGRTASYLPEYFRNSAKELQRLTKYSDEETLRAQDLMLQLSNLDKEGIQKAIKGAMGLATVFGMDLAEASMLVAKWMDGNTERMSRYGIRVSNTMTAEEKRNSVIEQLLAYYPRVEAETKTYTGKLELLKNAYEEVKEAAGRYVTENKNVLNALNWLSNALYDLADAEGAVERAKKSHAEQDKYWSEAFYKAANAVKLDKEEVVKLIAKFTELGPVLKGTSLELDTSSKWYKEQERAITTNWQALASYIVYGDKTTAFYKEFKKAIQDTTKAFKDSKAETGTGLLTDPEAERKRLEAIKKILEEEKKAREDARARLQKGQDDWYKEQLEKEKKNQEDIKKVHADARQRLQEGQEKFYKDTQEKIKEEKEAWRSMWQKVQQMGFAALQTMLNYFSQVQGAQNTIILDAIERTYEQAQRSMDNYYTAADRNLKTKYDQERREIENSRMREEDKNAALLELEKKHEKDVWDLQDKQKAAQQKLADDMEVKRKAAQKAAAMSNKKIAIWASIINTAEAVTAALTMKPWTPANFLLAAIAGAFGAIQTAFIAAQPIPLAKGFEGMVRTPTTFVAGEAGPEYLSVRPGEGGSGQGIRITIPISNYIAGYKTDEKIIEIIGRISSAGRLKIYKKSIVMG